MSFQLLKDEIIDLGLCQGCGLCAGSCKHIEMDDLKPTLVDYCIEERNGLKCGRCYENCPQVNQLKVEKKDPLKIYSLQATDSAVKANAASGGFVTALNKYLLETQQVSHLVEVKNVEDKPKAVVTTDPKEVMNYSGVAYGRAGLLKQLVKVLGEEYENIGIVGVPCEIRGAHYMEERMHKEFFKIGLFCNANMRTEQTDRGIVCSPCCHGCPAGVNAAGYVNLIRAGKYQEAVDLIREANPLPSICGRICTHECEYNCTLIGTNHPIAIRELKKFVTEWEMEHPQDKKIKKGTGKKVAVIGSGPSGLTAAYYLAHLGYQPTIFEKSDQVGGMLRFGVPKFRLPDNVLDYDIDFVKKAGVEIKTKTPLGENLTFDDLKKQGYEAIYVAIGQYQPKTLHLPGEDLPNVHTAIDFLMARKYRYWDNKEEFKGKTVGVLGGGPVAVDVAQTALRLGAEKVTMVDIVDEKALEMVRKDIPDNELKFIEYKYNSATEKFTQNGDKLAFNCHKVSAKKDDTGRMRFETVEGSQYSFDVDTIVIAIGQAADYTELDAASGSELKKNRGKIVADELTFETNMPGVFAGGDIIERGKNVAVAGIAHGRQAAISIDRYLRGVDLRENREKREQSFFQGPLAAPKDVSQKPPMEQATENLWLNFDEIGGKFDEDMAVDEAKRCLTCNNFCAHCQDFAGIYADLTAGEIGSDNGFTTVVAWTKKGQDAITEMIKKGLIKEGKVNKENVNAAIDLKMKRELVEHKIPTRQQIFNWIKANGPSTISALSKELNIDVKQVRYNALRLVQDKQLGMILEPDQDEPIISPEPID